MLTVFDVAAIILMLPVIQSLYQVMANSGWNVLIWKRMVFGMLLAVLSLLSAGVLETYRHRNIVECGYHQQLIGPSAPCPLIGAILKRSYGQSLNNPATLAYLL